MASICILLTWAAIRDLEIFQFDCKTAFLHAKLRHPIYARQFPGYTLVDSTKVLQIMVALYGLRQSAYEFYMLLMSLLLDLGMIRCKVDHGVFFGEWISPPDSSVTMPTDGSPLVLYVPIHVDDGLAVTNSSSLYQWFLATLRRNLLIVDLGDCSKFLSIVIIRDRVRRRLWLSSHIYVIDLLNEWNLANAESPATPFPYKIADQLLLSPNALPDISDDELTSKYQRLVGCLMYLAVATRPDVAYYAMWLGRFSAKPTRSHMLIAKHVLRYLGGTRLLALSLMFAATNWGRFAPGSFLQLSTGVDLHKAAPVFAATDWGRFAPGSFLQLSTGVDLHKAAPMFAATNWGKLHLGHFCSCRLASI
jgi:Reverse transcriptase (RNA-dependent DNA polymerase)